MNKNQFVEFHRLLAILKYELEIATLETNNIEYIKELEEQIKAIDTLMIVFIADGRYIRKD